MEEAELVKLRTQVLHTQDMVRKRFLVWKQGLSESVMLSGETLSLPVPLPILFSLLFGSQNADSIG